MKGFFTLMVALTVGAVVSDILGVSSGGTKGSYQVVTGSSGLSGCLTLAGLLFLYVHCQVLVLNSTARPL